MSVWLAISIIAGILALIVLAVMAILAFDDWMNPLGDE